MLVCSKVCSRERFGIFVNVSVNNRKRVAVTLRNGFFSYASLAFRQFSNGVQNAENLVDTRKIFELKTYNIRSENFSNYLVLLGKNIHLRMNLSKLVGYWTSEVSSSLNQTICLWEYNDYKQRSEVRALLSEDQTWKKEYLGLAKNMLRSQENMILKQFPWYPITIPSEGEHIYELRTYRLHPGKISKWAERFQRGLETRLKFSKPVGIFFTDIGPLNCVVHLWPYKSLEHRASIRAAAVQNAEWSLTVEETAPFIQTMSSKILLPMPFSPSK